MGTFIGRDEELRQAERFLAAAKSQRVARVLRITGASGTGKTALANEVCERAGRAGWLAPLVAAHRIQATLPLITARRIAEEVIARLGDEAATYVSGIESALRSTADAAAFESAFFRLIEALLLDRQVALTIDDAQWADRASGALLLRVAQSFADRPLVLVLVDRSDEDAEPRFEYIDETIEVREFADPAAEQLARALMPGATSDVVRAVVHHSRGRAVDISTIASLSPDHAALTEEEIAASARTIVASTLARLKPATREFLQICSLVGDPIEIDVLNAMWPSDTVLAFIGECSGHYLVQDKGGLRFVHLTVMQSVRETIPIAIPYHKRIIDAIRKLPMTLDRRERLVAQAAASGDRDLERAFLQDLAREAEAVGSLALVASAVERQLELIPFGEEAIALYARLSMIHNALGTDGLNTCREALERAAAAGIREGIGQLVASLLFMQLHHADREAYARTMERYDRQLTSPADRAHLTGVKLYAAYCNADRAEFEALSAEARSSGPIDPVLAVREAVFEGLLAARLGSIDDYHAHQARARAILESNGLTNIFNTMISVGNAVFVMSSQGLAARALDDALGQLPKGEHVRDTIETLRLIANSSPSDAIERLTESLENSHTTFTRRVLLGLVGAAAALHGTSVPMPLAKLLEIETSRALHEGHAPSALPLLTAALAEPTLAQKHRQAISAKLRALATKPYEAQVTFLPAVLAVAASAAKDEPTLQLIADDGLWHDAFPWSIAQARLATAIAKRSLNRSVTTSEREDLQSQLRMLGAPFFADLLDRHTSTSGGPSADEQSLNVLSRRERDVARLIAQGYTNREIAETYVLSERTIEGHVANIFNKLNVGSRSQVAVWFVANAPANA
ncbi:MAG: AAA family ATPase [bacterium]|nr:AAA family ATPase [bacterium]